MGADNDKPNGREIPTSKITESLSNDQIEEMGIEENLEDDDIAFYISGLTRPKIVKSAEKIILGRSFGNNETGYLDLEPFGAIPNGVSRHHAAIHLTDSGYQIEDLQSTNGTRLNDHLLTPYKRNPLRSGDLISVGQLMMSVYFNSGEIARVDKARLTENGVAPSIIERKGIPLAILSDEVMFYLSALESLQNTINEAKQLPHDPALVRQIQLSSNREWIEIGVIGLNTAIQTVIQQLNPFKIVHQTEIRNEWKKTQSQTTREVVGYLNNDNLTPQVVNNFIKRSKIHLNDSPELQQACRVILYSRLSITMENPTY